MKRSRAALRAGGGLGALLILAGCSSDPTETPAGSAGSSSAGASTAGTSSGGSGTAGSTSGGNATGGNASADGGTMSGGANNGGVSNNGGTGGSPNSSGGSSGGVGGGSASYGGSSAMDPGTEGDGDLTIGPSFRDSPDESSNGGAKKGTVKRFSMSSTASAIYPSDIKTKQTFSRDVQVYLPNGYVADTETPFIVLQDGSQYAGDLITALDNLINDKRLPPIVGVFVNPGPGDGTGSERSLEYDSCNENYSKFVETELLPKVATDYKVKFTKDPEGRAMMGGSSGGAAAFTAGWFRPDLYRRILTYSGSFVSLQKDAVNKNGAWDYAALISATTPNKPLRVFLEAGSNDNGATSAATSTRNWKSANQNMAAALKAKGYHYRYVYADGASHVDTRAIRQTLPEALLWLWRGYVPPK